MDELNNVELKHEMGFWMRVVISIDKEFFWFRVFSLSESIRRFILAIFMNAYNLTEEFE